MTAKKLPPRPVRWHDSLRAHPWLTWGTLASIATVLAVAVPGTAWLLGRYQTVEAADLHERNDAKQNANILYGQARIESLILRKQVADCEAKSKERSRVECATYQRDYREAQQRAQFLYEQSQRAR